MFKMITRAKDEFLRMSCCLARRPLAKGARYGRVSSSPAATFQGQDFMKRGANHQTSLIFRYFVFLN